MRKRRRIKVEQKGVTKLRTERGKRLGKSMKPRDVELVGEETYEIEVCAHVSAPTVRRSAEAEGLYRQTYSLSRPLASPLQTRPQQTLMNTCQHTWPISISPTQCPSFPSALAVRLVGSVDDGQILVTWSSTTVNINQARTRATMPGIRI
jgi:hypothetical protein